MHIQDIVREYYDNKKSTQEIAVMYDTYPSKIRNLLKKNGYTLRTKSESQKIALDLGKSKHPTKGTKRPEEVKNAISQKNHEVWQNMSEEEKEKRSEIGKDNWSKLTDSQKNEFMIKGQEGIRKSAKEGSYLEKHILNVLKTKYTVAAHKKGLIANTKLEVDLYVVDLNLIIEIDGPAHFTDLWNGGDLNRQIRSDNEKTGAFISAGYKVLRLKDLRQNKSKIYMKNCGEKVLEICSQIKNRTNLENFIEIELG